MELRYLRPQRRPTRAQRFVRALERTLFVAGFLALGTYGALWTRTHLYHSYDRWAFDQQLNGRKPTFEDFVRERLFGQTPPEVPSPGSAAAPSVPEPTLDPRALEAGPPDKSAWSGSRMRAYERSLARPAGEPLGRLDIPKLGLSVMVLEGTDHWTLDRGAGHIEGTAFPGNPGNIGIAGHRDGFFRSLKEIAAGDEVLLTTIRGAYRYRVDDIDIVRPNEGHVLAPSGAPTLTLVTCYPFYVVGDAPKRFIVKAQLEATQAPGAASFTPASYTPASYTPPPKAAAPEPAERVRPRTRTRIRARASPPARVARAPDREPAVARSELPRSLFRRMGRGLVSVVKTPYGLLTLRPDRNATH